MPKLYYSVVSSDNLKTKTIAKTKQAKLQIHWGYFQTSKLDIQVCQTDCLTLQSLPFDKFSQPGTTVYPTLDMVIDLLVLTINGSTFTITQNC